LPGGAFRSLETFSAITAQLDLLRREPAADTHLYERPAGAAVDFDEFSIDSNPIEYAAISRWLAI
jgi:hypothetical protein